MTHAIEILVFLVVPLGLFARNVWVGYRSPLPPAPTAPQTHPADADWVLLPLQLIGGLAALCWAAIGLLVFLSPLLILAWLVF